MQILVRYSITTRHIFIKFELQTVKLGTSMSTSTHYSSKWSRASTHTDSTFTRILPQTSTEPTMNVKITLVFLLCWIGELTLSRNLPYIPNNSA